MSKKGQSISIVGLDEIKDVLDRIAPKHARNLMRATVHGIAGEIAKEAKKRAPKDTGNLRNSIKTRRRKSSPDAPVSEVYVTTGKNKKNDGFYWRFIESGTVNRSAAPFVGPAKQAVLSNLDQILRQQFAKKLEAAIRREKKKASKAKK